MADESSEVPVPAGETQSSPTPQSLADAQAQQASGRSGGEAKPAVGDPHQAIEQSTKAIPGTQQQRPAEEATKPGFFEKIRRKLGGGTSS